MANMSPESPLKRLLRRAELWLGLAGLIGVIYGLGAWIHRSAQSAVLEEKFLATLAARIRPACIFNSRGAIEADFGAGDYIDGIEVVPQPKVYGYSITIKAKRHLAYAPLVTGIDIGLLPQSAIRGKMHDWVISVAPNGGVPALLLGADAGSTTNTDVHTFRLEILH
jgi:hypothetical protein